MLSLISMCFRLISHLFLIFLLFKKNIGYLVTGIFLGEAEEEAIDSGVLKTNKPIKNKELCRVEAISVLKPPLHNCSCMLGRTGM